MEIFEGPVITYVIIGITLLISFYAFDKPEVIQKLIMNPYRVSRRKEYYRFITSGFIHQHHLHLFFNLFSFYFFGAATESVFKILFGFAGNFYFIALYLLAIVVSDLPTYFKHRDHPHYNSLGASGGVSAVIFAFILFLPLEKICLYVALCLPGFILGTLYVIFSYYQGRKANDNINHDAHLYGALFGLLFCIVVYPPSLNHFFQQVMSWRIF